MPTATKSGGASTAQAAAAAAINAFLAIAPKKFTAIVGSVATGGSGGSTGTVVWQQQLPIVPAWCTAIDYNVVLPVNVTLAAGNVTTATMTLSPFAPYSALSNQITLGGAPPWPMTELTAWYMDWISQRVNFDPNYPGYGNNVSYFASILDLGPTPNQIGGAGSLNPGAAITNVTAAPVVTPLTWTFKVRQQLQRKRHLLWGAIPFGDPENRPYNLTQINGLLGINPEANLFVANGGVTGGSGNSVVLNGAATVKATYELAYIDLLPAGMGSAPTPSVAYGLQLVQFNTTGINSGTINPVTHRTAMIFEAIHHLLINNQLPIQADYFGLWDDQDQQSSRWNFDAAQNTMNEYFDKFQRDYRHYPLKGQYLADFMGGVFPEVPSVTPYDALMSPDAAYAATFGVPVTPALTTAIRIPQATGAVAPYIKSYDFGLVKVPY